MEQVEHPEQDGRIMTMFLFHPFRLFHTFHGTEQNKVEAENSKQYLRMFNEFWNDDKQFADVTEQVVENISNVYKENSPEFIYFVALYNIFSEFLEDISEDVLPNEATGFKDSQIWNKLYDYQKDAALAIINKLEKQITDLEKKPEQRSSQGRGWNILKS